MTPLCTCAGECENIRSIIVEVSASDYFEEPDTEEAQHLFGEILSTLKVSYKYCSLIGCQEKQTNIYFNVKCALRENKTGLLDRGLNQLLLSRLHKYGQSPLRNYKKAKYKTKKDYF